MYVLFGSEWVKIGQEYAQARNLRSAVTLIQYAAVTSQNKQN